MTEASGIAPSSPSSGVWIDLPNVHFPEPYLCTGGRPRPQHLSQAQRGGVHMVIDLCSPGEHCDYDERQLVESLGMNYLNIPIGGPTDLNRANARKLAEALRNTHGAPTLLHCSNGNRAGALLALKAHFVDQCSTESALTIGRSAGLQILELEVRCILAGI